MVRLVYGALVAVAAVVLLPVASSGSASRPNILFIIDESTHGDAWFSGRSDRDNAPVPLPNLWSIMDNGTTFNQTYVASPVCCPSRSAIWSGRHIHRIPHYQENPSTGLFVNGSWNNHEGLPPDYDKKFSDYIATAGYATQISGKRDYSAGGHSLTCRVEAWLEKVKFPFTLANHSYGWYDETGPIAANVTGNETHSSDWKDARQLAEFIKDQSARGSGQPWLGYFGPSIVHPPYVSSPYWLNKVNYSRITAPSWVNISELHPEDFQASMKKKMASDLCCSDDNKRNIRWHYLAMVAEFDAMVGLLMQALHDAGVADNTLVIVTSDHGDMDMTHRQFYKMSPYDKSARVPLVVQGPKVQAAVTVTDVVSSLDLFPTMLDYAGVDHSKMGIDGQSLVPFLTSGAGPPRRRAVVSQFHGDNIRLSWFLVRQDQYKYVTYGSGTEVAPRLFDMVADPGEHHDLAAAMPDVVKQLDAVLRGVLDYPAVAEQVEAYNKDSFVLWRAAAGDKYNATIANDMRFAESWAYDPEGCFKAIDTWLTTPNNTFEWAL